MTLTTCIEGFTIRPATSGDVGLILKFIKALAAYEKMERDVVADETLLSETLFGPRPFAEVLIGEQDGTAVAFALFFHNFSTFVGRPGLYLEDLYVEPEARGRGLGKCLLSYLGHLAKERGCGRVEWCVLDWNENAIDFYTAMGAKPVEGWTVFRVAGAALERLSDGFDRGC